MTTCSMTMEVMAVTKAFIWLESQNYTGVCILSDSMSMIRKLEAGTVRRQWLHSIEKSKIGRATFVYVPGHAGVRGNERADMLAGTAIVEEGQPMDKVDIINAIMEVGKVQDFDQNENMSLLRMKELGLKKGIARNDIHQGRTRGLVNQYRTGVVSRLTLVDLLRRGSEHLWMCPECCDDSPPITHNSVHGQCISYVFL